MHLLRPVREKITHNDKHTKCEDIFCCMYHSCKLSSIYILPLPPMSSYFIHKEN